MHALADMNGYKYRCNAYVSINDRLYMLSSEENLLNVRKAEVKVVISADKQEGAADSSSEFGLAESDADVLELTALVTSDDLKEISGKVVFYIKDNVSKAAANEYSVKLSSNGIAKKKCKIKKEGRYTISASYVETDTVSKAASGNTLPYYAYNASQKEDREAGKQMEKEIYDKKWEDISLKNVLSHKDEIKELNDKYDKFEKKEFMETGAKDKLQSAVDLLGAAEVLETVDSFSALKLADVAGKKNEIKKAREAYNKLSDEQKELLKGEKAEEKLKTAEDMLAASDVMEKINKIGSVTKDNLPKKKKLIEDAVKAYNGLTSEQKALLPANVKTALKNAEKIYNATYKQAQSAADKALISNLSKKLGVSAATASKIKDYADKNGIDKDTILLTDKDVVKTKTDKDVKGSKYGKLQAKAVKAASNKVKLTWKKVKESAGYKIYQAECGKKKGYKLIKTIKKNNTKSLTVKKLKKGKGYRFIVRAYKVIDGKEVTVSAAKAVHVMTSGGKKGNVTKVKVSKTKLNLKRNKKFNLKVSVKKSKKKVLNCRPISYESGNVKVATVSKKGRVTAKAKGKCTIYVYAHNGVCTTVVVTVK